MTEWETFKEIIESDIVVVLCPHFSYCKGYTYMDLNLDVSERSFCSVGFG